MLNVKWMDIACIVFVCVTVNHLGLIRAVKTVTRCHRLWIVDCPKCFTFWTTLVYCCDRIATHVTVSSFILALAISFLCAYIAIWLELLEGIIDKLYDYIYGKIYPTADTDDTDTECA